MTADDKGNSQKSTHHNFKVGVLDAAIQASRLLLQAVNSNYTHNRSDYCCPKTADGENYDPETRSFLAFYGPQECCAHAGPLFVEKGRG